jgi:hypothetical protein
LGGLRSIVECLTSEDADTRRYALAALINLSNDGPCGLVGLLIQAFSLVVA